MDPYQPPLAGQRHWTLLEQQGLISALWSPETKCFCGAAACCTAPQSGLELPIDYGMLKSIVGSRNSKQPCYQV